MGAAREQIWEIQNKRHEQANFRPLNGSVGTWREFTHFDFEPSVFRLPGCQRTAMGIPACKAIASGTGTVRHNRVSVGVANNSCHTCVRLHMVLISRGHDCVSCNARGGYAHCWSALPNIFSVILLAALPHRNHTAAHIYTACMHMLTCMSTEPRL